MKSEESFLDNLYIASPCSVSWDSMVGDNRARSCGGCSRTVFNVSDMTRREAEKFLLEHGTSKCMKFYRRKDGTIMTDDCPRVLRKLRDTYRRVSRVVVAVVAFVVSLPAALAQPSGPGLQPFIQDLSGEKRDASEWELRGAINGGPYWVRKHKPITTQTATINATPTTTSVEARILTKERTLPGGQKINLVINDPDGKVIQIVPSKQNEQPNRSSVELLDSRAFDSYQNAKNAIETKKFELAEFYLEESLKKYDQQSSGDKGFRKLIETTLNDVRSKLSSSSNQKNRSYIQAEFEEVDEPSSGTMNN